MLLSGCSGRALIMGMTGKRLNVLWIMFRMSEGGKGIASALLSEAFSRAKALGAKKAYVISDLPFYEKLGFEKAQQYTFYRKA